MHTLILRTSQITYSLQVWSIGASLDNAFEAKHSYFQKSFPWKFHQLAYSLASRHQQHQFYLNTVTNGLPGATNDVEGKNRCYYSLLLSPHCLGSVVDY